MEIMKEQIYCYKYYNGKGQRLAIMAEKVHNTVKVTIIKCSTEDVFFKQKAINAFRALNTVKLAKIDGQIVNFHIVSFSPTRENWKSAFNAWCKDNFYKKVREEVIGYRDYLVKKSLNTTHYKALKNGNIKITRRGV